MLITWLLWYENQKLNLYNLNIHNFNSSINYKIGGKYHMLGQLPSNEKKAEFLSLLGIYLIIKHKDEKEWMES